MKTILGVIAAVGLATGVCAEEVQFSDVPKAVQKAINKNLNGGVVKKIDKEATNGKTVYEVGVRREGKDKHMRIDADGKLLPNDNPSANASIDINTDKNDGKILGIVPMDGTDKDKGVNAEAQVGDKKLKMEADVDRSHDVELSTHHDLNAKTDVDIDHNDPKVTVDTDSGRHKIFHKGDGKLLGFIPWKKHEKKVEVNVDTDANVGSSAGSVTGSSSNK